MQIIQGNKNTFKNIPIFSSCLYFVNFHSTHRSLISLLIFSFHIVKLSKTWKHCLLMYYYSCCSGSLVILYPERVISQMEMWGQKTFPVFNKIPQLFEKLCSFHYKSANFFPRIISFQSKLKSYLHFQKKQGFGN